MPARRDIKKILLFGSGPIVIGQACEFDYSGNQAVQALKEEGYTVILLNPNPATVMTTPGLADKIYMDPLEVPYVEKIIQEEAPDAVLPTMGGQTALNLAIAMDKAGLFKRYNIQLIGASIQSIELAEDRGKFKELMTSIGLESARSIITTNVDSAMEFAERQGLPLIIRPSYTLGGRGGSIVSEKCKLLSTIRRALDESPAHQALIEESLLGWQEFEMEVMRDKADNVVIICSIENIDPMGIHTGDSITVAPVQTLSDREYQAMRTASIDILRAVGVDCGGSNVQFAFNPADGRMLVIEMNPRVSRSSALASKATGFPIARCSAKLSVGYTLDEIANDITQKTVSCFEPSLDYVAVKVPRFELEKLPSFELGSQMRSIGEALAIGRSFTEALNKALRSCEIDVEGLDELNLNAEELQDVAGRLHPKRIFALYTILKRAMRKELAQAEFSAEDSLAQAEFSAEAASVQSEFLASESKAEAAPQSREAGAQGAQESTEQSPSVPQALLQEIERLSALSGYAPWVLYQFAELAGLECQLENTASSEAPPQNPISVAKANSPDSPTGINPDLLLHAKRAGLSDTRIARLMNTESAHVHSLRSTADIHSCYHLVDTCSGEFKALTPYFYSTWGELNEADPLPENTVIILGSGPNRIGQGLEFDACCTLSSIAYRRLGTQTILINSNPETVSTDFNISDRLYLEPLTTDDVREILHNEKSSRLVVQLGGQTALNIAEELEGLGAEIIGTSTSTIRLAEDRQQFAALLNELDLSQPENRSATTIEQIYTCAREISYPVLLRPSFVLGGRSMMIAYSDNDLDTFVNKNIVVNENKPVLVDKFLDDAFEYDVDALCDGESVYIAGIMEHIEAAGIHSGDSAAVFPAFLTTRKIEAEIIQATVRIALKMGIQGFLNIQFAVKNNTLYVLEVNPRASRTVPFISKASAVNLVDIAVGIWEGRSLKSQGIVDPASQYALGSCTVGWAVKEAMFSFDRFLNIDPLLGPEMKSTGETIGIGQSFGEAFAKASSAAGTQLPRGGTAFVSVNDSDKETVLPIVQQLMSMGFRIAASEGTATFLAGRGVESTLIPKHFEGEPNILNAIEEKKIDLVINTPLGSDARQGDELLRIHTLRHRVPYTTTISAASAAIEGIRYLQKNAISVRSLPAFTEFSTHEGKGNSDITKTARANAHKSKRAQQ